MDNLNDFKIPNADGPDTPLEDFSCVHGESEVIFRNLKHRLIQEISNSEAVLGCVAWLTDPEILEALSKVKTCIVVQKEDFLRPDLESNSKNWKNQLRSSYNKLNSGVERYALPGIASSLNTQADPTAHAIRCVGNHNSKKDPAFPRMHNKFIVLGRFENNPSSNNYPIHFQPQKVWTGSFNFTKNAVKSFENAIILNNSKIAEAYANEFAQIFALSEDLDWTSDWIEPFFRIGS